VIISGSTDQTLQVWDLATGNPVGNRLTGHTGAVTAVATAQLNNRPVAISGSTDETIRVWDLTTGRSIIKPIPANTIVWAVTTAQLDGRPVIIGSAEIVLCGYGT